jgi:hypothetical protein
MIRNLKVLIAAAMALAAFGALSASAHAAEEKFHCSVEPCRLTLAPDGTAGTTTAHQVLVLKGKTAGGVEASASFTCNQLTGEATTASKTTTELTFTNIKYENSAGELKCKVGASETVEIDPTGCDLLFTSANGATGGAELHVLCPVGQTIHLKIKGTSCLTISALTATGLGYVVVNTTPNRVVTATAKVPIPNAALTLQNIGNANCAALGFASTTGAEYTTGNTIVKAETSGGVAAEDWFE